MDYEKIREKYNEVMYDERDIIEKFLKEQTEICYGTQMYEWGFNPCPELTLFCNNEPVTISYIRLDKDKFVVFHGRDGKDYECCDFHYGELVKIIEILPDIEELARKKAIDDLRLLCADGMITLENPFKHDNGCGCDSVERIWVENGNIIVSGLEDGCNFFENTINESSIVKNIAEHVKYECLHRSNEYKKLMGLLSLEENLYFNFIEEGKPGNASFYLHGTDCTFDVLDVSRDDSGNLTIFGKMWHEDDLLGEISLKEKDIRPEYLNCIIETIEKVRIPDIINVYNAHNPELVKKINEAWRKDRNRFAPILKALYERDKNEFADTFGQEIEEGADILNYAHEIMEGVGDDWDLETILSFLRIK